MRRTEPVGYYEAAIDFNERSFKLDKDCVGGKIPFTYMGQHLSLHFPYFDFEDTDMFNHPKPTHKGTDVGLNWLINNDPYEDTSYGSEVARKGQMVLSFTCNHAVVRSSARVTARKARAIKQSLMTWQELFPIWIEVMLFKDLEYGGVDASNAKTIDSYFLIDGKKARRIKRKNENSTTITVNMLASINHEQLIDALSMCQNGQQPPSHYLMLISALKHMNRKDYRQCVLDAATAYEICLTSLLDIELRNLRPSQRKLITDKYKMIVGLSRCLRDLGVNLPSQSDTQTKIAEPRNNAIHHGKKVEAANARDALNFCKDLLYSRFPL